jgi:xanthine dehydrogenase YagR molybdenum-binding subunit
MSALLGTPVDRVDAVDKVTGRAKYAADIGVASVAHAVIATSTVAKGRLVNIDTSHIETTGVLAVITPFNAPRLPHANDTEATERVLQVLQDTQILYQDQPIAVVVADTLERAQEAALQLRAEYKVTASDAAVAVDFEGQAPYTPESAGPRAEAASSRGNVDSALQASAVRLDQTYTTSNQHHNPMELHGLTAVWQGPNLLTLYDTTQHLFGVKKRVARIFDLDPANVRVISHYVGGGFGCKGSTWSHVALCALAARVVGRAVRLVLTRPQMFSLVGYRPRTIQRVSLGANKDGTLVATSHEVVSETSRFDEFSEPSALQTRLLYACPNLSTRHQLVRLDVPTPTFTRAPGEASGTFALEVAMDELAYSLGMDPLELRRKNHAEHNQDENKPWSAKSLLQCYDQAAERFGWSSRVHAPLSHRRADTLVGWGMATATYPARQSGASARAVITRNGDLVVQAGTQDLGTGTYTIMSQIAADTLGLPMERVHFELGDTALPETPVSGGSQTAASTGSAVREACSKLRAQLAELASSDANSPLHGVSKDEIAFVDQMVVHRTSPDRRELLSQLLQRNPRAEWVSVAHTEATGESKKYSCHSFGAQFVEVHVDPTLGEIRVQRCVSAFAAGNILNAKTARSQFMGGMVWGIGLALMEQGRRDSRTGRSVVRDLADYHGPVNADIPELEVIMVAENDAHVNQVGAKGIGEIGITGMAAAVANAVFHATGKRVRELPITLDKLI